MKNRKFAVGMLCAAALTVALGSTVNAEEKKNRLSDRFRGRYRADDTAGEEG